MVSCKLKFYSKEDRHISSEKKTRVNAQIRVPKVRLIDQDGKQLGVVDTNQALGMAQTAELDLVEVSPNAQPPVCRIMDYGKYLFEQSKRKAAQKKKQKQIQVKEIKFRPATDVGDYQVKIRKVKTFLERGDKVKISIRFKGREMQHRELGTELLERIKQDLSADGVMDQQPRFEGRQITMIIGPSGKQVAKPLSTVKSE